MKFIVTGLAILLLFSFGCSTDPLEESTEATAKYDVGTKEEVSSNYTFPEIDKEPLEPGGGLVIHEEPKEEIEQRAEKSVLKNEECCSEISELKACCCDKILEKYEALFKEDKLREAMSFEEVDVYYKQCVKKFSDFEKKIIAVQDKYLQ